jgi:hypothetical protein
VPGTLGALANRAAKAFWANSLLQPNPGVARMSLGTILLIVLVLILIGIIPAWPHSRSWGYGPSGAIGVIVVILLILALMGRI